MRRSTLWRFLAIALPTLGALVAPLPAVDLAYQLRAGAEILDHGAIPSADTWTFTVAGTPWLDQQWAAQVVLALVFRLGGWTGLVMLRAALVALAFGLLLLVVRRRAPGLGSVASALLVFTAFLVSAMALALRPQLIAIDLFAAVLLVLAIRDDHPRAVWAIPVLAIAWANVHGTFLIAPAVCGLAWLADLADLSPSRGVARHRMLVVAVVATIATLVTPFGPSVWGYVVNLTSNPTIARRVSEWQPPSPLTPGGALVWVSLVAVALLVVARIRGRARATGRFVGAIPWPAVLTLLLFGGLAAVSGRGTAWWPFVAVFVVAPWLVRRRDRTPAVDAATVPVHDPEPERTTPPLLRRLNLAIVGVLIVAGVALLPMWRPADRAPGIPDVPRGSLAYAPIDLSNVFAGYPARPAAPYRVWNPQAWGSWLELAAPADRYAVDSRIELFPSSVWDDAAAISSGNLGLLARYRVDIVVTDRQADAALEAALAGDVAEWTQVFSNCDGAVWFAKATFPYVGASPSSGCPPRPL